jgi:hypothetical protein
VGDRGEQFLNVGGIGIDIISIKDEGGARRWWGRLGQGCGEGEGEEWTVCQREAGYGEVLNIRDHRSVEQVAARSVVGQEK